MDPRLLALAELPHDFLDDAELLRNLVVRYGPDLKHLRFRLIAVPLSVLEDYRLEDFDEHFNGLIEADREYDAIMLRCGEEPGWPWEDAEDRFLIARGYVKAFETGRSVRPVMLDFSSMADLTIVDVIDGHHRIQAAHEAGVTELLAYGLGRTGV